MDAVVAVTHPLDPLSLDEIASAVAILKDTQTLAPTFRFPITRLEEPTKADLAAHRLGDRLPRLAFILAMDISNGETFEGIVDLTAGTVSSYIRLPLDELPYGQPPVMLCEFETVEGTVKSDPRWIAAVKKRGITDEDIPFIQIDPFSSGYFGREFEKGKRIVRAVSYWREDIRDNGYAHPIEGVVAVVDLITNRVVDLVDDEKIIPVPRKKRNYGRETFPEPRPDLAPLHIVQPQGPSFTVDGWKVEWQNWSFRVGFTPREGLVLHELGIRDQGRLRPVVFRASVTEMVVPYADPTANHYWKSAFDAGEYGLGRLANCLELGCDCLGHIHYFDVPAADDFGQPFMMKNAICMHEEDYGILWKHYEFRNGVFEVRRSRRLVISFFATVGNYDYGFYWYLYQDGTIQLEAKLTGIIQTAAVATGETYPWGGMVDDNLGGPTHQHFFNARLHMDVDGGDNTVTEHEFVPRPWGEDNPYGNVFDTRTRVLKRELDSPALANGETGRYWKVSNTNTKNSVGKAPGYKIVVMPSPVMLAQPDSTVARRGGFAKKHIWVTAFDAREKYASGDYPNVHAGGDGLPGYVQQNREIENADVVLWHSFGHTHVCKPEDFPIMPVEYAGFTLKPNGFFASNIAMDLPPEGNSQSVDNRLQHSPDDTGNGSCCHM
ncbi:primary-amine oxidase [Rhizobium ruizarguesonis]|uniref:Amine oxidase n=1 Tax=Rhizobium ruizarguesonis TaxID=2081791 RepID=A0AAE4YPH8_9HYPH|nr:primary-amine oxidase [Rhizobium ruizarguesonis]MBY5879493.1 primary-amine oxidase [Rhizobium leguminosarum]TBY62218.1 primary-amine oxidase [Rhizobium leguminosarum bv. viciae]MBY5894229.1 primary-amine oxidase [Rhizobium leguminosarum]MCB2400513.1 primary-amine oxidase [Rhizobium ruizarguesonis]NEH35371.1 primary-amine oxidase [Rhizobium ruizarguesonis]